MDSHLYSYFLTGTLALTTMSSSRVFMDADVQPSKDYLEWYSFESSVIFMQILLCHFTRFHF